MYIHVDPIFQYTMCGSRSRSVQEIVNEKCTEFRFMVIKISVLGRKELACFAFAFCVCMIHLSLL